MQAITEANVNDVFKYHPPTDDQVRRMNAMRDAAKLYADAVLTNAPRVPDRTRCLNMIKDSTMLANAAVILEDVQ